MEEYADYLARGENPKKLQGFWFKKGERTMARFYHSDLDSLPFPYYGPEDVFLIDNKKIRQVDQNDIIKYLVHTYPTMIARGCPMKCTFCSNNAEDNRRLRIRSVDNVISEIEHIKNQFGMPHQVMFRDDTVMSLRMEYLQEFVSEWKKRVNIPFTSSGVIPNAVNEEKFKLLLSGGFQFVKMGIQSGSPYVRNVIYKRPETDKQILKAADIFNRSKISKLGYMFITDNPWEKDKDIVTSLRFISKLPRPFTLSIYSLNLYPGTELFYRGVREGSIKDPYEWYNKSTMTLKETYFNMLYMMQRNLEVPYWLIWLLTIRSIYKNRIYQYVFKKFYSWYFRNLTEFGIDRRPHKKETKLHKILNLFFKILNLRKVRNKLIRLFQ
ncbi:MAG: radical SAM protein [Spirochaetes bacterium]|nr:radical SAM protein [Spirochaetota bacterium]